MTSTSVRARERAHLAAEHISIERGGRPVLTDLSITISPGTRLAVVGENGRGKSTLLHLLAGTLSPDTGTIRRVGSIGVAEQEIAVGDTRTVGDLIDLELTEVNAALAAFDAAAAALAAPSTYEPVYKPADEQTGTSALATATTDYDRALELVTVLDAWNADRRVDIALEALGAVTDRSRPLDTLSVGQRYRVRLASLLGAEHDLLLLDEPTNHLDQHGLEFLSRALVETTAGVVLVSHDRALLADVATDVLDLDPSLDGRPRRYGAGWSGYVDGRRSELERWAQAYDDHRSETKRLTDDLSTAQNRLQSGWKPPKGTGKHQRATRSPSLVRAVHRRLDDLAAHSVSKPPTPLQFRFPDIDRFEGATLLHAEDITVDQRLDVAVSVVLEPGGRLLITGPNGAGKSTLLEVLAGVHQPTTGSVSIARSARIGFVAQVSPTTELRSAHAVYTERCRWLDSSGVGAGGTVPFSELGLLSSTDAARPIADLSMGQQRRLDLALALAGRPQLLFLDEPTNHLSIALVDELTEAFETTNAALVVVTHDRQMRRDLAHWTTVELPGGATGDR